MMLFKKMDYITEKDIGEEVKFTFDKKAFESEKIYCEDCKIKTKKVEITMPIPKTALSVRLNVFRCGKCNKEYLNFKDIEKSLRINRKV